MASGAKNPEDLVRLEPRTPGLQVKHFTNGPCGTLASFELNTYADLYRAF